MSSKVSLLCRTSRRYLSVTIVPMWEETVRMPSSSREVSSLSNPDSFVLLVMPLSS